MLRGVCSERVVEKTRYEVAHAGSSWVGDVYGDRLAGIVLAEIELQSEDQYFEEPDWIGQDVTCNPRFHKTTIARLCREAGSPLSVVELLNGRPENGG
jgi:CYTH domain-containing protein